LKTTYWLGVLAAAVFAAIAPSQAAAAEGVAPLTGETLIASELPGPGTSTFSGTCDPLGTSTFEFTVTGTAVGPYPGTFVERGTLSFGPFGAGAGFGVAAFEATFTIQSAVGTVTGTKSLATPGTGFGACGTPALPNDGIDFEGDAVYRAQITTPRGSATDSGTSFVNYGDTGLRDVPAFNGFNFDETFISTDLSAVCEEDSNHQGDEDCDHQD
jgi:hypothetical protein